MNPQHSRMYQEAAQAPHVVREQLEMNAEQMERIGAQLRAMKPHAVITCARGSSDNAATFAKYLIESRARVLTSSAAPSVSSLYEAQPDLHGVVCLAISQSGKSPDLLASVEAAKRGGALVIALCNSTDSPLAGIADHLVPLRANVEMSVAATKSYLASLSALLHLVTSWAEDQSLLDALLHSPEQMEQAWELDWGNALPVLQEATNLYVVARGFGLGVAQEVALKLKETCGLHAEAFSAAEVKHGPMALVRPGFPVLMLSQNDGSRAGIAALANDFSGRGAEVLLAGIEHEHALSLPTIAADPAIEPMLMIQSFYRMAAELAFLRGFDPDKPPYLKKITETL